jgi:hypothetical protein
LFINCTDYDAAHIGDHGIEDRHDGDDDDSGDNE